MSDPSEAAQVLHFWFGPPGDRGRRDARWFGKDEAFDRDCRTRFLSLHEKAAAGALEQWRNEPADCLALIILLDQMPRNMFRGARRAFATDPLALEAARHAVAQRFDQRLVPVERMFVYLPFEHSESLADQFKACELTQPLTAYAETADAYRYALMHRDIIQRFGRFPHRNAILGRESTPEEIEFLKQPGSSF